MAEPTAGTIVLYAVLAVLTMGALDWVESKRMQTARMRCARRGQLGAHRQLDARPARKAA